MRARRSFIVRLVRVMVIPTLCLGGYMAWEPGTQVRDGRHDLGLNGTWIAHGWLGGDDWFATYGKSLSKYRDQKALDALAAECTGQHITDLFPHLCPCNPDGSLPSVNRAQVERFLDAMGPSKRILPWIGGPSPAPARYHEPMWRTKFCEAVKTLLVNHPRLAGVQLNLEPLPSGDQDFLKLLDELRTVVPSGKLISVAAYPPPTRWHPHPDLHWEELYFREVAKRSDQLAVMMYDTALQRPKLYRKLMADWTEEAIRWAAGKPVLLGAPTYADVDVGYHDPGTENLQNALFGIHAGLGRFGSLPGNYQGVAIYCQWETEPGEWSIWRQEFLRTRKQ